MWIAAKDDGDWSVSECLESGQSSVHCADGVRSMAKTAPEWHSKDSQVGVRM